MKSPIASLLFVGSAALLAAGCERPPMHSEQVGYRGTGIVQISNPRITAAVQAANVLPEAIPALPATEGPKASQVYKNVKVLGDLGIGEFTRTMVAMTNWVAPQQGCNYCHVAGNFESDDVYAKVVSRRMLEMTRHINADWKPHVAETGVTCYTCHRGNPVPNQVWFDSPPARQAGGMARGKDRQNTPLQLVGLSSLPYDVLKDYLSGNEPIRIIPQTALPTGDPGKSIRQTESTYGLMFHMSESLGVNCTYCHNSRSFTTWEASSPARVTAYHGIRMVRDLNNAYLDPLKPVYPETRLGPTGDAPKANCGTCHQGLNKPLNGVSMAKDFPQLTGAPKP